MTKKVSDDENRAFDVVRIIHVDLAAVEIACKRIWNIVDDHRDPVTIFDVRLNRVEHFSQSFIAGTHGADCIPATKNTHDGLQSSHAFRIVRRKDLQRVDPAIWRKSSASRESVLPYDRHS